MCELVVHSKVQFLPSVIDVNNWNGQEGICLGLVSNGRKFSFQTNHALTCLMLMVVYVCGGELVNDVACCIQEVDRWGGGSVMVWAGISYRYKTALHFCYRSLNAQRYRDNILYLNNANIRVVPWPVLSSDLAPIEHVWDEFGRRVYSHPNKPTTVDGLRRALTEEWNNSHKQLFKTLSCQCVVVALHASMLEVDIPGTDFSIWEYLCWSCCVTSLFQIVVPNVTWFFFYGYCC